MTMAHQTREKKKPAPRVVAKAKTKPRNGSPARTPSRAVRPPTANVPIEATDE